MAVSGCTSDDTESARPEPTRVEFPKVEPPKDRDRQAATKALRELGLCTLLDPTAVDAPAGTKPVETSVKRCTLFKADGDDHFAATIDDQFDREKRYRASSINLGGAKAYQLFDPRSGTCEMAIPVSFEVAVLIIGIKGPRSKSGDVCIPTKSAADVAVDKLGSLVFRSNEPDQGLIGACVDFPYGLDCLPNSDVPVPTGGDVVLAAADGDPRVTCAFAREAVTSRFGKHLVAVITDPARCFFVEPSHTVVIEISVHFDSALNDTARTRGGQNTTLAGRPATSGTSTGDGYDERRLCLLPVSGARTGLLCVAAHFLPGRGVDGQVPIDTKAAAHLEPTVVDIVSRYFT
ncbi:hypothetical protein [Actinokineospora sp.]|uniref:hypothetical protein n=1 Tax=Actinokineospora sp. TaxID=1872133 RepID=UPI003D6C6C16